MAKKATTTETTTENEFNIMSIFDEFSARKRTNPQQSRDKFDPSKTRDRFIDYLNASLEIAKAVKAAIDGEEFQLNLSASYFEEFGNVEQIKTNIKQFTAELMTNKELERPIYDVRSKRNGTSLYLFLPVMFQKHIVTTYSQGNQVKYQVSIRLGKQNLKLIDDAGMQKPLVFDAPTIDVVIQIHQKIIEAIQNEQPPIIKGIELMVETYNQSMLARIAAIKNPKGEDS